MPNGGGAQEPIRIFYCYSHDDKELRKALSKHLRGLQREQVIEEWYDANIVAGEQWERSIYERLASADIVLALVSAGFIASDYIMKTELPEARKRHRLGKTRLLPIMVDFCSWKHAGLGEIQFVQPGPSRPLSDFPNLSKALNRVATEIEKVIQELRAERNPPPFVSPGPKLAGEPPDIVSANDGTSLRDVEVFRPLDEPWCPQMVVIPPGSFLMGSPDAEEGRFSNEGPQHWVTIRQGFAIGRYPVTFDEYDAFCEATKRSLPNDEGWGRGRRPVINVSWHDAMAHAQWLSSRTGFDFDLPSDAEWEYACRAGTTTRYAWGDSISPKNANYGESGIERTSEVGSYPGNRWGLHDMHGNVWEWCADDRRKFDGAPQGDPRGSEGERSSRVVRGGSWFQHAKYVRSACRPTTARTTARNRQGFRLCLRSMQGRSP